MRPVFCGNFDYETRQADLERLFSKYGKLERVDMKSGFAFVYFKDERDADDAIRGLDDRSFGHSRRRLSVEWARGDRGSRPREGPKSVENQRPTKTLFVINFDPIHTRVQDIERHFDPYGKVIHVRIRRNFAFVQFETQEEATKALERTHMSKILDRLVSVEYALRDDADRGSPRRGGYGEQAYSPKRGNYGERVYSPCGRSRSPVHRRRPSPDYGSPVPRRRRPSPDYGSPVPRRQRVSPDYGSPVPRRQRVSPDCGSPITKRAPVVDYVRGHSPVDNYNGPKLNSGHSSDYDRNRSRSPVRRTRSPVRRSPSPYRRSRT
ncbi:hypothetical protein GIB67_000917 [Kingdonia uniflora]|uniref:RRM domain-containing protein n=1 Tax=Kingdonia uniflora TaxID=39325 RepID=A0A7J7MG04_9MAGN|nr:hypothetical protein GIB67_000917 [Kingdonia uniflora]